MPLYLTEANVGSLLTPADALEAVEGCFRRLAAGEVETAAHITRVGDLEHAPDFLRMIREQTLDGKAVVYPHRRTEGIISVERWTAEDERKHLC